MPVVEYFHRASSSEKADKLPEWASLTAAVTGITIFAFATSSFYVLGVAGSLAQPLAIYYSLAQPLAIYFSLADYLRITPSWAIPTLGLAVVVGIIWVVSGFAVHKEWGISQRTQATKRGKKFFRLFFGAMSAFGLISATLVWIFLPDNWTLRGSLLSLCVIAGLQWLVTYVPIISGEKLVRYLSTATFTICLISGDLVLRSLPDNRLREILLVVLWSLDCLAVLSFAVTYVPVSTGWRLLIVIIPCSALFALTLGRYYGRFDVQEGPLTQVLFESEKDKVAAVEGRVIFDLERYLLLFTKSKSVLAIPHEIIKSIQTPPLPAASPFLKLFQKKSRVPLRRQSPTQTPSAIPAASPTPAQTSPRPTETPRVLPSPVGSPTATAEAAEKPRRIAMSDEISRKDPRLLKNLATLNWETGEIIPGTDLIDWAITFDGSG